MLRWAQRRCRVRLARSDLFVLPFADASFDFVQCLNVIEHIGTLGDSTSVTHDSAAQRVAAIHELLRVTRPGGYLLLSGVNRLFPLDFFHLQDVRLVRLHSPREKFSLACGDYDRLARATGLAEWTRRKNEWRRERAAGKGPSVLKPQQNDRPEVAERAARAGKAPL